ncbi:hypothetical protein CQW23_09485 [Capsicum baccatum]|uniref:Zinc finger PMZ-type domain-containing protein n=1 Tax=Capsicum baccatum TaxID=33114 RepID=A0A2G2WWW8_CAPBA|nr:hypothetical protein CQW23_09485 [Capsicum baccatum]
MSIAEFFLVSGDFMGEWMKTSKCWKWRSFNKVTIPIPVRHNSSYDKFITSVMQSGDLNCASSDVVISYVMHSRKKVDPMIINSGVRVLTYIMDADADGFRPILRINVVERYDVMITNIVESLNSILMDEREYPVSYIFNSIAKKFGEKFRERHAFVGGKENIFVSSAERILRDNKSESDSLYVGNPNGVFDEYTMFGNGITAKVNLLERSRFCQKFDLMKMPCEHAMAALR